MKKLIYILPLLALLFSCKNKGEEDAYADWTVQNQLYINNISLKAMTGEDGWLRYLSYSLSQAYGIVNPNDNNAYAYVQILKEGEGTYRPLYNDTVSAHFICQTIPHSTNLSGAIVAQSYQGSTVNELTDVPRDFAISDNASTTPGLSTALMHMHEGDSARIVVPFSLAYGTTGSTVLGIRPYSTLIYTMKIVEIKRY